MLSIKPQDVLPKKVLDKICIYRQLITFRCESGSSAVHILPTVPNVQYV